MRIYVCDFVATIINEFLFLCN